MSALKPKDSLLFTLNTENLRHENIIKQMGSVIKAIAK